MMAQGPLGAALVPLDGAGDEDTRQRLSDAVGFRGTVMEALASVATVSPFLGGLMRASPERVERIVARPWRDSVNAACRMAPDPDLLVAGQTLRRAREEVALAVGLADLCAAAPMSDVCAALSDFADAAVEMALASVLALHERRTGARTEGGSGFIVLGMGKLGARELNFSSDIDLIVLTDPERARAAGIDSSDAVRLTRRLVPLLQERTPDGYVFRVDLRLRPDPASTPVAVSTRAALRYAQTRARPWERQALVKARQIAGDRAAGRDYLASLEPSLWPQSYDFGAVDDALRLREEIALVKGAGTLTVPGHNIKLGRGGIREVEFFVQALQRVAGGRDRRLRGRSTVAMLATLARAGWVEWGEADALTEAYERLRRIENRLQMVADEQTHTLPPADGLWRIARMMGEDDFEERTRETLAFVHDRFTRLGETVGRGNPMLAALVAARDPSDEARAQVEAAIERWAANPPASLRTTRARRLFDALRNDLARALAVAHDRPNAIAGMELFLARLSGGVDALSRLEANRELLPVIVLIVSATPRLAEEIARRARLLDVLVDPAFFGRLQSEEELVDNLANDLDAADSYEEKLDALRQFGREQGLLINVRTLTGSMSPGETAAALTRLAGVCVRAALEVARAAFEAAHGRLRGGAVALVALGKFGGGEMTATSDLDLVFLYDADPDAGESDGPRKLSPGHYYNRLAQRFVGALAAPTAAGTLYEVDLRLRPSGRSGPLATHIRAYERYQREDAWTWEHMALTRARPVAGDPALQRRAMDAIAAGLARPRDLASVREDVLRMRERLAAQRDGGLKHAPGGQVDIEFIAQHRQLELGEAVCEERDLGHVLPALAAAGALTGTEAETLLSAHRLYQALSQLLSLAVSKGILLSDAPEALRPILVRAGEAPDFEFLCADLVERRRLVRELFERLVGSLESSAQR